MALHISGQAVGSFVATRAILLERLHHNPVKVPAQQMDKLRRLDAAVFGRRGQIDGKHDAQAGRRADGLFFADGSAHFIKAGGQEFLLIQRRLASEQLVKQHSQAVDVGPCVDVQATQLRLFRTHVGGGADELLEGREQCLVGQTLAGRGLGHAKIYDLRHRHAIMVGHQNVRRLDVAVNDPLLVRVLDGLANLNEKVQALGGGKIFLVAIVRDFDAADQFHDKVGPAGVGRAGLEDFGNVGMIHERQRLPLRFESGDNAPRIHTELDDLEGDAAADGVFLLGHVHHATSALANLLKEFVAPDPVALLLDRRGAQASACVGIGTWHRTSGGSGRSILEEKCCFIVNTQQILQAQPQGGIVRTHLVQIRRPLGCDQLEGGTKQDHFAIG